MRRQQDAITRPELLNQFWLQEPWVNDAVVIGGASAVLSPIIQWGHTILQSKPQVLNNLAY